MGTLGTLIFLAADAPTAFNLIGVGSVLTIAVGTMLAIGRHERKGWKGLLDEREREHVSREAERASEYAQREATRSAEHVELERKMRFLERQHGWCEVRLTYAFAEMRRSGIDVPEVMFSNVPPGDGPFPHIERGAEGT